MINLVPLLSTVLPIIASTLLISVISINFYFKLRRKFPISVNCWFCNTWTKVHYDDRDSFDCPNCLQYNGFTKDGDYNKIIPEQHDELMNQSARIKSTKTANTNGLCAFCNNNQQLKVFQLANFVPLVEENYDVEIEHFQKQLEKAYKLCRKCDKTLKKTIEKQNAWIFGNRLKNMCINGAYSIQKLTTNVKRNGKFSVLSSIVEVMLILLVATLIAIDVSTVKYFTNNLAKLMPDSYLPALKSVILLVNTQRTVNLAPISNQTLKIDSFFITATLGLFLQIITTILAKYSTTIKLNRLLCWVILILTSWIRFSRNYAIYVLLIEAFSCIYLLSSAFSKEELQQPAQKNSGKMMRKLVKNLEYTCTDMSDLSDFENISSSTTPSQDKSVCLHKSCDSTIDTANPVLNYSDLNKSLHNLNLGMDLKSPSRTFSVTSLPISRPRPVLSPAKFHNPPTFPHTSAFSNTSWVAGGFCRDGLLIPTTNVSRSSSESSGFGSQHDFAHAPAPGRGWGDFDRYSCVSDFIRTSPSPNSMFAPIKPYNPSQMGRDVFMRGSEPYHSRMYQNWSDRINAQPTPTFRDLNLFSSYSNNVNQ